MSLTHTKNLATKNVAKLKNAFISLIRSSKKIQRRQCLKYLYYLLVFGAFTGFL
jgi:hypothetical protein